MVLDNQRTSVLIDGDNISAQFASRILKEADKNCRPDIARVYLGGNHQSDWFDAPGFRPMFAGCGKNAADLLLSIDAMELGFSLDVQTFVIATSDGDFTHVVQRLRERGHTVIGVGEEKAPIKFRRACSAFVEVSMPEKPKPPVSVKQGCYTDFDEKIKSMISVHSVQAKGMAIQQLAQMMHQEHQARISSFPEKTWRGYLSKRPTLYDPVPKGKDAMVRFKPSGFAGRPSTATPALS